MIVEVIILKSRVTKLEIVARHSTTYDYGLFNGDFCYSLTIEHNKNEYIICTHKSYDEIYKIAEFITKDFGIPLNINRITMSNNRYNIVKKSVCVGTYDKIIDRVNKESDDYSNIFNSFIAEDDDLYLNCDIDFDMTSKNWDNDKEK